MKYPIGIHDFEKVRHHLLLIIALLTMSSGTVVASVSIDEEHFPDSNFRYWLLRQSYGKDAFITDEEIAQLTTLNVGGLFWYKYNSGPVSLKGIEYFTELTSLKCYSYLRNIFPPDAAFDTYYYLNELDVSANTKLTYLDCSGNHLSKLDLSKNTAIEEVHCYQNRLRGKDMDAFIQSLPVNTSGKEHRLYVYDGSTAYSLFEDNEMTPQQVYAAEQRGWTAYWCDDESGWRPYAIPSEAIAIDEEHFPDKAFRNYLLTLDYGKDGLLSTTEIAVISNLEINRLGIASLKGIEHLTELEKLSCVANELTTIDFSKNKKLTHLSIQTNYISGQGMDRLLMSLPSVGYGRLYALDFYYNVEHNEVTKTQRAYAKKKGWDVLAWDWDNYMEDYCAWPYLGSGDAPADSPAGDVNADGVADVADIASVISAMAGEAGVSLIKADVNGDGIVDVADIATVIDIMAGKGEPKSAK